MKNLSLSASLPLCLSVCLVVSASFLSGCTGGGSGSSGSSGGSGTTTPATTVPTVASITPASVTAGATSASITVTGTGFTSSTAIQVGDVVESTTYSSSTQVSATVAAAQLAQGGLLPVIALNTDATSGAGAVVDLTVNNPAPTITSTVPGTLLSGTAAQTVSILGTGFVPTTVIQVGGTARPTTFVASGEVITVLTAADVATSGTLALTAVNPTPAGGTSAALSMPVNNPVPPTVVPTVASISPASVTAGATSTTVTVTGTGFNASTAIQVGGVVENTAYVSSTQVSATVAAAQLAQGGLLPVIALNPDATSGAGAVVDLTVNNPAPAITSTVPATLTSGTVARTISVLGTGFVPSTVIQVGGSARATSFVTSGEVIAVLTTADLATGGTLSLTAVNPAPAGGASAATQMPVNNPVPGIRTLSPTFVFTGGSSPATITVNGLDFLPVSVVQINGIARATTYVSATQLTFQLTVADQAAATDLLITVVNPTPGGGTSFSIGLTVTAPTPTPVILSVNPTQFLVGSQDTQIEVQVSGSLNLFGTGPTETVDWNGTALVTNGEEFSPEGNFLLAVVPASLLTTVGTASITVVNPTSTPTTSAAVTVTIVNPPPPTLTSISPASGPINTATVINLYGTGFTSSSTVAFNGAAVQATFVDAEQLTLTLPAASVALPGNGSFTVTTPAPGGGTTAPLLYTAYIGLTNNSMVFNPVNGLFYASVPSSAGAPYGNSIVSIDPETGALGTPIQVGSEPNKLAISSDGTVLWVGLDGASAVRQVNLTTGTAGLQFALGANTQSNASLSTAVALAALPGAPNSVVVSTSSAYGFGSTLGIFDSGVLRGATTTASGQFGETYALQVDGTRGEVYAAASGNYYTFTYGTSGLTLLASSTTSATYATSSADEIQVAGGHLYTDFGQVFDAESGSLLGTLYNSGTTAASGPTVADTTLGKAFVLDSSTGYNYNGYNQIQVFNTADFTSASASSIPVSINTSQFNTTASRLTRWGTNGLAFRSTQGLYSLRSNLVKDLSSVTADIGVTLAATGGTTTGTSTTYTATVSNAGPSDATNVALTASIPATGVLQSVSPSAGSCSTSNGVSCNLGGLANGASVTVAFAVLQNASGSATLTAQASASETDPTASNNSATATATITGSAYNLVPTIASISPASIPAGSTDTTLTVTGTGFSSGSSVQLGGTTLVTTYASATSLTATVPAAQLTSLGWAAITVANPTPGGGTSSPAALSVYSVITLGVNHILYDPYSRNIMASVGSGSSTVTGNSIVAITPDTGTVGTAVSIGSQPENLALTSDSQILYTVLTGNQSVARYNMLTQQADYTFAVPSSAGGYNGVALRGVATVPGTENTVVLDLGTYGGNAIFDFDPANQTAAIRGQSSGFYSGTCDQFLNATEMVNFNSESSNTLNLFTLDANGFVPVSGGYQVYSTSTLNQFGCFKLSGGNAYAVQGGVANPATVPAAQLGVFGTASNPIYLGQTNVAPDASLQQTYFVVNSKGGFGYSATADSIESFNDNTFISAGFTPLGFAATEGTTTYTVSDLIRWGQDGLAVLTSTGHIYLLRGAAVVPGELVANPAATLASSSSSTLTHGSGNTLVTLTGTNFLPGLAVDWNGSYRTTTIVDATHVTVAIPASDLSAAGTSTLTAVNPGAAASNGLTITID